MVAVLGGGVGVVLGALAAWALTTRRAQSLRAVAAQAERELAVRDAQLALERETLERERAARAERELEWRTMETTFEALSNRVLAQTVEQFSASQERVLRERDSKLDLSLKPLTALLDEYKRNLAEFNTQHAGALSDVHNRANELLEAQQRSHEETRRLNQLLGRSSARGAWGEIQLQNVMEASGLRRNIDYDLQVTSVSDAGQSRRPDCVVHMPSGTSMAIDAKFPFEAFEAATRTEDAAERERLYAVHADALRKHVKALRDKSYWELIQPAPEFVVCFVPSDVAITAAFDADRDLLRDAAGDRVLIVGPTNLLSLLWSVALVLQQHQSGLNAQAILDQAYQIVDRIRLVAEPVEKMGRSLEESVKQYNKMVASVQSRLIVSAQNIRRMGGAARAKAVPELRTVNESTTALDADRWGVDRDNPLPEGVSEIIEIDLVAPDDADDLED